MPVVGRFAPTPSGPLHFGSLVAALGSFLNSKSQGGKWIVRIEDVDIPRAVLNSPESILQTLEVVGLEWDGPIVFQSTRLDAYSEALEKLRAKGLIYECDCTRKMLEHIARRGVTGELFYPGTCRNRHLSILARNSAERVRVPSNDFEFTDAVQGVQSQNLSLESGDFVLRRADGIFAYHLAVVVDDAWQRVSEVVRGSDLLSSTARHQFLQKELSLPEPVYVHLPVVSNLSGEKLSKQTNAEAINQKNAAPLIWQALQFLGQVPPLSLRGASVQELLNWARQNWHLSNVPHQLSVPLSGSEKTEACND